MQRILAIGATGHLGRLALERLQDRNYRTIALVGDIESARRSLGENVDLVTIRSPEILAGIDRVVVFADGENIGETLEWLKTVRIPGQRILFDFRRPTEESKSAWGAIDDVVMGGVSESGIRFIEGGALFSGNVSIENNGGFASVRSRDFAPPLDLSDYEGIQLQITGDGKRYKFIARCEDRWDGVGYCYSFDTLDRSPETIRVPFEGLIPVIRAKTIRDGRSFERSRVYSLQLMQSKFEYDGALNPRFTPGPFALTIHSIGAYGGRAKPIEPIVVGEGTGESESFGGYRAISLDRLDGVLN